VIERVLPSPDITSEVELVLATDPGPRICVARVGIEPVTETSWANAGVLARMAATAAARMRQGANKSFKVTLDHSGGGG
jgi:hypothetical protein